MKCNCRLKEAPPRTYTDPDYHALTCGFNALTRKLGHNHIVTKAVATINQMGVYRAMEPANPEAPDNGTVPDAYLVQNPESDPLPAGSPLYDSIDVTVVQLVHASDYKCRPGALLKPNRQRPMDLAYDRKVTKHARWNCLPLVLDHSANLHGTSRRFLDEAKGASGNSKVLFLRKECAAAICRMIEKCTRGTSANGPSMLSPTLKRRKRWRLSWPSTKRTSDVHWRSSPLMMLLSGRSLINQQTMTPRPNKTSPLTCPPSERCVT